MRYGLIGAKLSHSYSKLIHNLLGDYPYDLVELTAEELGLFMQRREFDAINVTIPYKKDVIPYLYSITKEAEQIGSVNTIVNKEGKLFGYNTDYFGFSYMAKLAGINFTGKKVMILGTGGTYLTAFSVARDAGACEIVTVSRSGEINYGNLYDRCDCEIIINTTPVGMYPNNGEKLLDLSRFSTCVGVIDVIYNPLYTELLFDAKERCIPHTNGLPMLVAQAKFASEFFFDTKIPDVKITEITNIITKDVANLVLVGMPGSGKSSVGRTAAKKLGREFFDTDSLIEEKARLPIPEIFAKYGEASFRQLETEVVAELCKQKGLCIATGGGAILTERNRRAMLQNGFAFHIERDLSLLDTKGRPLSKDSETLRNMREVRLPIYQSISSAEIQNNKEMECVADELIKAFRAL